eukprot:g63752.t1
MLKLEAGWRERGASDLRQLCIPIGWRQQVERKPQHGHLGDEMFSFAQTLFRIASCHRNPEPVLASWRLDAYFAHCHEVKTRAVEQLRQSCSCHSRSKTIALSSVRTLRFMENDDIKGLGVAASKMS